MLTEMSFAGDESLCFVVEKSSEHHEGQLQVTKAVYFQDKYSDDERDCDALYELNQFKLQLN